ncbi:MAG: phage major capsid protein [Solirubrobacterales bacterium]|nr:phage major capsid protein [Solirubrobacterales bacterium]
MAWNGDPSNYTDEQYQAACVLDRGGDDPVKQRFGLPVRDPDGTLNCDGVAAAQRMIGSVKGASPEAIAKAHSKLEQLAKQCEQSDSGSESRSRPQAGSVEERALDHQGAATVADRRLHGVIPYGVESRDLGGWREVIDRGALADADLSGLIATREHDRSQLLGRHPSTLTTEDRADGFHWSVDLPSSPVGEDVRVAVERGDLRAASWRMVVAPGGDRWDNDVRHVHNIAELRDVTVTAAPAYGDEARAEYRSLPEQATTEQEAPMAEQQEGGGLRVESRNQGGARAAGTAVETAVEDRVISAMRGVNKGEMRSLTEAATATPVTPPELSTMLWDKLRDAAVVLASGVPVISTSSKTVHWPRLTADISADFYSELDEITESDPGFDEFEVDPKAIKALVRGSAEAFEDSDPDLLQVIQRNLQTILGLKLDHELIQGNSAKGFSGLVNQAGINVLDAGGSVENYDFLIQAIGVLGGKHVPGPYVALAHPWTATHLALVKEFTSAESNVSLPRPDGVPDMLLTTQVPYNATAGTSSVIVYAPAHVAVVRRRDVTIEVDRSQEFSSDSILVRGKLRASLFLPYPEAVCVIQNVPAPDPSGAVMAPAPKAGRKG